MSEPLESPTKQPLPHWACGLLIALAIFAGFGKTAGFEFVYWDDDLYVASMEPDTPGNPHVVGGLSWENIRWALTSSQHSNWHPITWLSHMLDVELFGVKPGPMHAVNVGWHLANALLLYGLLARLTGWRGRSLMVALLFAVHPLHVESVAWIAERKDLLSVFFGLLAMWAYCGFRISDCGLRIGQSEIRNPKSAMLFMALSLMCKPMLVTLPVVLLLLDGWPLGRWEAGIRQRGLGRTAIGLVVEKWPLWLLAAASSVAAIWAQDQGNAIQGIGRIAVVDRLANAALSYGMYLWQMIWPAGLSCYYPHPITTGSTPAEHHQLWIRGGAAAGGLAIITALGLRRMRRRPYWIVGWLWYLATLLPVIGVVQVGGQARADRYTYLPLVGIFIAICWTAAQAGNRTALGRRSQWIAGGAVIAACLAVTMRQVEFWRDTESLLGRAMAMSSQCDLIENQWACVLCKRGEYARSQPYFEAAVRIRPDEPRHRYNYGMMLRTAMEEGKLQWTQQRWDKARVELQNVLQMDPNYPHVRYELANLWAIGKSDDAPNQAAGYYKQVIEADPRHLHALNRLAVILSDSGRSYEALGYLKRAMAVGPINQALRNNFDIVRRRAVDETRKALESQPGDAELQRRLQELASPG